MKTHKILPLRLTIHKSMDADFFFTPCAESYRTWNRPRPLQIIRERRKRLDLLLLKHFHGGTNRNYYLIMLRSWRCFSRSVIAFRNTALMKTRKKLVTYDRTRSSVSTCSPQRTNGNLQIVEAIIFHVEPVNCAVSGMV